MEASVPVCRVTDFMSHLFCDMLPHSRRWKCHASATEAPAAASGPERT